MNEFKRKLFECQTAPAVQQCMKEFKKEAPHMLRSEELTDRILNVANDRLRELLKKEK